MAPTQNILDLSTEEISRPTITVDKKPYELRRLDEFSIVDQARFARCDRLIDRAYNGEDDITAKLEDELTGSMDRVFLQIVINGAEIAEKLSGGQKHKVLNSFLVEAGLIQRKSPEPSTSNPLPAASVSLEDVPTTG